MKIVGLTGQTGAGKSLVSEHLRDEGFPVVDCDLVARQVTKKGEPALAALTAVFSPDILTAAGELDRRALGRRVFSDRAALKRLNETIFPFILDRIRTVCTAYGEQGERVVILDAPTLFESGADALCSAVVGVCASEKVRKMRIMTRDGLSEAEAVSRMNSQHTEAFFKAHCDFIIENNDDRQTLRRSVTALAVYLREMKNGHSHS